ncbi:MAG TPA: hypothetical protein VNA87_07255 [Actinomycetota bacterium]|nr:hypothetical protein [Actinomycetota bacterium]
MTAQTTLVFIYGPPAAGKLTVANALSEITGYKVFHNHASMNLVHSVLEPFTTPSAELTKKIRLDIIEAAMCNRVDLIFTMVYAHPDDEPYVADIESAVARADGRVCYVQLVPSRSTLNERVVSDSRQLHRKIQDAETLQRVLDRWDVSTPRHESDLSIDNTMTEPGEVARTIVNHHNLSHVDHGL